MVHSNLYPVTQYHPRTQQPPVNVSTAWPQMTTKLKTAYSVLRTVLSKSTVGCAVVTLSAYTVE